MVKKIGSIVLVSSLILGLFGSCVSANDSVNEAAAESVIETAGTESQTEEVPDQGKNQEQTADQNEECEWNVLLYLCGTDLESINGAATKNLKGIASALPQEGVNFLIETGGTQEWDPEDELGFEIANDKLQRWYYGEDGFVLVDEAEEACMSDDRTLTDFIRWAGENYSAKKNLLILWDHGGGSSKGLICDENYGFTIMPVYMLEEALREGGTHFDLVLTDTCLMASLEMCQALAPYADYLAASEEVMAGDGTNYGSWVQYLYDRPECSPVQLGKRMCDATQQYYAEKGDSSEYRFFTMSLIDLSKTDAVAEAFNRFMHEAADLVKDPGAFYEYAYQTHYAENYYLNTMYDLFDLSQRAESAGIPKEATHALQDAVEDAVVYNLRSDNHMYAHGLSVYYPMNNDGNDLDHFARTCKNPEQLSFLDSINLTWEAPAWVYEETDRHPQLDRSTYLVVPEAVCPEDGSAAYMTLESGEDAAVFLSYALYYRDKDSGVLYTLGESGNLIPEWDEETEKVRLRLGFDGTWATMEGKPLCMSIADETESYILYNVPVEIDGNTNQMRVLVDYEKYSLEEAPDAGTDEVTESADEPVQDDESVTDEEAAGNEEDDRTYELLGVWDGFDAHTGLPGRNVDPLSEIDGLEISLYDVVYSELLKKETDYISRLKTTLTKDSVIDEEELPSGEYLVRFVVRDVFNHTDYTDFVTVNWDGESLTYSLDS